jgi:hypothetical protein
VNLTAGNTGAVDVTGDVGTTMTLFFGRQQHRQINKQQLQRKMIGSAAIKKIPKTPSLRSPRASSAKLTISETVVNNFKKISISEGI